MHRLFILPGCIDGNKVTIADQQAHQVKNVLRFRPGDQLIVLDNSGIEYQVQIVDIKPEQVMGEVIETRRCTNEVGIEIALYQAMLKGDKFEMVLQKCTELGIAAFVPVICERCVGRVPGSSKADRWRKIIAEAAEQSGRGKLPTLHDVIDFEHACEFAEGKSLLPWEGEQVTGLRSVLQSAKEEYLPRLNVFVGPEGGFSDREVAFARDRGVTPVTLGKLTLRAETAGLVATSAILYEFGELGGN